MAKLSRNFIAGKINKDLDARLTPNGQVLDQLNIHNGSAESGDVGVNVNALGNLPLTTLKYDGIELSSDAVTIGAIADNAKETMYWMVHDPSNSVYPTGKCDLIVSFNTKTQTLVYHVISVNDGDDVDTTLNFNQLYLITAINIVDNLLFFSDNYNPPRVINVTRNYGSPIADVDQFTAESILVIKKPPVEAPTLQLLETGGQQNFIENRFICFGYRYKYADNEYSATSQFSEPAFAPNPFFFTVDSFLNEGMVNNYNAVLVTINTGSSLVKGIDLLFKEAGSNIIKVIEKINKEQLAISDDTTYQFSFDNGKIYTLLPDYEILRLYDNVPLLAQAQTLMGNRLMYGNYVEGYDLIDTQDQPVNLNYVAELVTEDIGLVDLPDTTTDGNYTINGTNSVTDSILRIDLSGLTFPLPAGGMISLDITLDHAEFTGSVTPTETSTNIQVNFSFFLINSYTSVYDLATSDEFVIAIQGNPFEYDLAFSCDGTSLTDRVNCALPASLDTYEKYRCGITSQNQPISIITTPVSSIIGLQFTATRFVDYAIAPTVNVYEYYSVTFAEASYQEIANPTSLHSNRQYQAGIVYMDDYNRATTALVSPYNTINIPCGNSDTQNKLQITIPKGMLPPTWATRYKFVVKANQENYETIYSSIFFQDPNSNDCYFLLEGENGQKIEQGDRLIVKADTSGAVTNCVYATVLEKSVQVADFIVIHSTLDPNVTVPVPAGVYMKINPNSFKAEYNELSVISYGMVTDISDVGINEGFCPTVAYTVNRYDSVTELWVDYSIPAGSQIRLYFDFERLGAGGACEERTYTLDTILIASANYDSFREWWIGDNIESILNTGTGTYIDNVFIPTLGNENTVLACNFTNRYQFLRNSTTNQMYLAVGGVKSCTGLHKKDKKQSKVSVQIDVFRADNLIIFETEPQEALPDIYFENHLSFPIVNGLHTGNIQNQTSTLPAIIDTEFFNCYAFGNGAESYKIRDSAIGKSFNLGNRVVSVSAQDYKQAHRFADITYSGVYNDESNVNKFNEFNLGLINYKPLEDSFGYIYKLDGRETDILVLQEDRISYVLAGKNLLSDATGGGTLTSVPEVLGTQIARVERYGISANPESYAVWGYFRFFTDVKRGAVLQIAGNSYQNDQLTVISDNGMRTYFRDAFIDSANTQKLGGYDPYLKEYVLSINEVLLPTETPCTDCSILQEFTVAPYEDKEYCINVGKNIGETTIEWTVIQGGVPFEIIATYNGVETTSGQVTGNGFFYVNKNLQLVDTINVLIQSEGTLDMTIAVQCVTPSPINLVEICVTNNADAGQYIHNEFNFVSGSYSSPTTSNLVTFETGTDIPLISRYNIITGLAGTGSIPNAGATVRMICNQVGFDDFVFSAADNSFKYLVSSTLYDNTPTDIQTLLNVANVATPNQASGTTNYAEFVMGGLNTYVYLIWDYRAASAVDLCYSTTLADACCDCADCVSDCREYFISNSGSNTFVSYRDCYTGDIDTIEIEPYHGYFVSSNMNYVPQIESGSCEIQCINTCGENTCDGCVTFDVEVFDDAVVSYQICGGSPTSIPLGIGQYEITTSSEPPLGVSGIISINFNRCGS